MMNTAVNLFKTICDAQSSQANGGQMFLNSSEHLPPHTTHAPGQQPHEPPYQQWGYH